MSDRLIDRGEIEQKLILQECPYLRPYLTLLPLLKLVGPNTEAIDRILAVVELRTFVEIDENWSGPNIIINHGFDASEK